MGWYGDYDSAKDVVAEKVSLARPDAEILGTKATKTYGAILFERNGEKHIDFFIFREDMYKPLPWVENMNRIPDSWIRQALPFSGEYGQKIYAEYMERKKAPKLSDILEQGASYRIWGQYTAIYRYKVKRTHVFELPNGQLTRFRSLEPQDVVKLEQ